MDKKEKLLLLHTLKHTPEEGEVYITWGGETFLGNMQQIKVETGIDQFTVFEIKGILKQ